MYDRPLSFCVNYAPANLCQQPRDEAYVCVQMLHSLEQEAEAGHTQPHALQMDHRYAQVSTVRMDGHTRACTIYVHAPRACCSALSDCGLWGLGDCGVVGTG